MSLENIGELGKNAKVLKAISSMSGLGKSATKSQTNAFNAIRDSLKNLSVDEATKKLKSLKLNPNLQKELLEAAKNGDLLIGTADEIENGMKKIGDSGTFVDKLKLSFKGLVATLKPLVPYALAVGGVFVVRDSSLSDYILNKFDKSLCFQHF